MIWLATIVGQISFGLEALLFLLTTKYDYYSIVGFSIPVGFGLSSLFYFACGAVLGTTAFHTLVHTIFLFVFSYILMGRRLFKRDRAFVKPNVQIIVFFTISVFLSLFIVPHMYYFTPRTIQKSISGDLPEEVSLNNSFYRGVNSGIINLFKIRSPFCYRCMVRSRWLTAFHSAILRTGYASLQVSMIIPSLLLVWSMSFLFLNLSARFLKSTFLSILALIVFLFSGGFGFTRWLEADPRHNRDLDFVFLCGSATTEWSHPLFHWLFAFRPSQLSCAVVFSIFTLLVRFDKPSAREFSVLGLLLGLLPACQTQVFLLTTAFVTFFIALNFQFVSKRLILALITFSSVSAVQLLHYIPRETYKPDIPPGSVWRPLSARGVYFAPLRYWFDSLGVIPFFSLVLAWFFVDRDFMRLYLPSTFLWLYANYHAMQPYVRQNVIVFYPLWVSLASIAMLLAMQGLVRRTKSEELKGVLIGVCFLSSLAAVWSALLGYGRLRSTRREMWSEEAEAVGAWIAANTPKKTAFAACPSDYNTVSALAGKVLYHSTARMQWHLGYATGHRAEEVARLLRALDAGNVAPKVRYIVQSKGGCPEVAVNNYVGNAWVVVYQSGNYSIYARKGEPPKS
jgi:hypothetical protein